MLFVLLFINYVCIFVSNLIGMKKNATVKIMLDPQSKETQRAVKLRITFNRVTRFRAIPSEIKLTDDEFGNEKLKTTGILR